MFHIIYQTYKGTKIGSSRWFHSLILVVLNGLLLGFSFGSSGVPFLLFVAFIPLLHLNKYLQRFGRGGWLFFFYSYVGFVIFHVLAVFWVRYASVAGAWAIILLNSLFLSLVISLFRAVSRYLTSKRANIFLVSIWISFEYLHLQWELALPWVNLGNAFATYPQVIQWYEYTGSLGGTLWVWIVNVMLYRLFSFSKDQLRVRRFIPVLLWVVVPIILSLFHYIGDDDQAAPVRRALILQPNLDPYTEKFNYSNDQMVDYLSHLADSALADNEAPIDYLITPETAINRSVSIDRLPLLPQIGSRLRGINDKYEISGSIIGSMTYERTTEDEPSSRFSSRTGQWYVIYNSALYIDSLGTEVHHKSRPLVFVESIPYIKWMKQILGRFIIDMGGTSGSLGRQATPSVFPTSEGDTLAPVICYESVFGDYVGEYVRKGANAIAVITNDAWWGDSDGYRQHLLFSVLRAIEHRRYVLRSANTGVSAVIRPDGTIENQLSYGEKGYIIGEYKPSTEKTFYTQHGDYIAKLALFIGGFLFLFSVRSRLMNKRES